MNRLPLVVAAVLWILAACQPFGSTPPTSNTNDTIPTPVLGPTDPNQPPPPQVIPGTPALQGPPTLQVVSPPAPVATTPVPQGTRVSCPGTAFSLVVPPGLNLTLQCLQTPFGVFDNPNTITIWRFAVNPSDDFCLQGCVDIIPLAQAQATFGQWAFPPYNAGILLSARKAVLSFQGGQGTRTLEIQGQALVLANNQDLRYIVRGYSQDGKWAVYVDFPIAADVLPSHPDPTQNTNPNAHQPLPQADDAQALQAYNQSVLPLLEQAATSAFTPNLDLLDRLVQSLVVK